MGNYTKPRQKRLTETIEQFKNKITADELFDLLYVGHYIYQQGTGLIFSEVKDLIKKAYDNGNIHS
jgi:predicted glycosyltransferase